MHAIQHVLKASGGVSVGVGNSTSSDLNKLIKFLTTSSTLTQHEYSQQIWHNSASSPSTLPELSKRRQQHQQRQQQQQHESSQATTHATISYSYNLLSNVNGCSTRTVIPYQNNNVTNLAFTAKSCQVLQNLYQQQQQKHFHTQHNQSETYVKKQHQQQQQPQQQQQQQHHHQHHHQQQQSQTSTGTQHTKSYNMSSLAAEPIQQPQQADILATGASGVNSAAAEANTNGSSCHESAAAGSAAPIKKPCFSTGLAEILQFMELIGNLKHTKRTGWVLRDVNDCESISGHMYRMSMLTFLLDGSEGLNQIRCMELALVHDLAESLVGDITPFCGVSKDEKRAMEFKAMEDICKLIEPRGKRIMELFEEYEHGESAESRFVKDLDRLDMVMQAFEYEKRDNCLLKHQEFFDSTEGKFNHPFVKKLVNEIYEQRKSLATAKGATPPPPVHVPSMELSATVAAAVPSADQSNGQQQTS